MQSRPYPRALVFLIVAIAAVNTLANEFYWYWLMRWFDMPMHFAGGVWVAGTVVWWRFFSGRFPEASVSYSTLMTWALLGSVGIGLGWELFEAGVSWVTVGHTNDILDTLGDLFFDTLGGFVVTGASWWYNKGTYDKRV